MAGARILIVEDEDIVAGEIKNILVHLGYTVAGIVDSGEEAVTIVTTTPPDVVLMDIVLYGGIDGIQAAERIREHVDIPIIFLTAHDDDATLQHAKISDPFGYLIKPCKSKELHSAIEIALYRHTMEKKLIEMNHQLEAASRLKSDFLANMSHELRTPLNAMIGYTSLTLNALKDSLPPEHLQNLTRAEQSARMLLQLINDVLDFSKIEAGRLETFIEKIDLQELLEDVLITADGLLANKTITLHKMLPPKLPVIASDYTRLKQILDNLVGNAIKFTEVGAVTLRAIPLDDEHIVRIEVEDSGCGISPEFMENLFELFRQADGSIKKKFGGTGLGLAIVKRLCDMLSITIGVQTELRKGTLFWLRIPFTPVEQAMLTDAGHHIHHPPGKPPAGSNMASEEAEPSLSIPTPGHENTPEIKALILCFCKSDLSVTLERHLAGLPLEIVYVQTVAECLHYQRERVIWTILVEADTDHSFEILRQLKAEPILQGTPVLMLSPGTTPKAFPLGPVEYIEKPTDNKKLLEALLRATHVRQGEILVVDDDRDIRMLYSRLLSKEGYTTLTAANGREALQQLQEHPTCQAIVLDLMMSEMDGFQVLEQLQQHPAWQRIPVVVVTAKDLSQQERTLLQQGTQLLLEKGKFSIDDLSRRIQAVTQSAAIGGARSILVIDDNEMNLNLTASVFESSGYTVYQTREAQEGLAIAHRSHPDAIVMDLAMPGMDGFEATQLLKQAPDTADITVIACSAFATKEYRERAFQAGCEGYITKPIEPHRLIEQVTKCVLSSKIKKKMALSG